MNAASRDERLANSLESSPPRRSLFSAMPIGCHNSGRISSANHRSTEKVVRQKLSLEEKQWQVREANLRAKERERRRAQIRAELKAAERIRAKEVRRVLCRCGITFTTTNPNVRWHSNACRLSLGKNRKAQYAVRARKLRLARVKLAPGEGHTYEQWMARLKSQGYCCYYCGAELTKQNWTRDHKTPLCRGGSDEISNIVAACRRCNCRKNTLTDTEFINKTEKIKAVEEAGQFPACVKGSSNSASRTPAPVKKPQDNHVVVAVISTRKRDGSFQPKPEFKQLPLLTNSFSSEL